MALKGQLTTADYMPKDEFNHMLSGLRRDKRYCWELFCLISFCCALRMSDVRLTRWIDILGKDQLVKNEQKTKKNRPIKINPGMREKISELYQLMGQPDKNLSIVANPRTNEPYSKVHINEMLKVFRYDYRLTVKKFSTHTFRKTFGRHIYESMGRTAEALILLNEIFKHSSIQITKVYIGLRQEEIDSVFDSLQIKRLSA